MTGWSDRQVVPPRLEMVMELRVSIGEPETIGESGTGTRRFIPITGGIFEGKGLRGEVIPGGADWQLNRPDGVLEVKAVYAIRTADDQVIAVDNRGIVAPLEDDGNAVSTGRYVATTPTFHARRGTHDWLNRRVFTGTITPSPQRDFVTVRVFQIG